MNKEEYLEKCKKHAEEFYIALNPDKKRIEEVISGLFRNKKQYGEFYCPCRIISRDKKRDKLNICPCVYHMGEIELNGKCLCGLFVRK